MLTFWLEYYIWMLAVHIVMLFIMQCDVTLVLQIVAVGLGATVTLRCVLTMTDGKPLAVRIIFQHV